MNGTSELKIEKYVKKFGKTIDISAKNDYNCQAVQ